MSSNEQTVLIFRLRGQNFPVKDSGIEGDKADPFFEIRNSSSDLGTNPEIAYNGKHPDSKALYKSDTVKQNLNPSWKPMAVDLNLLCGTDQTKKLLFDIYDWDRFSSPDFMSFVELSVGDILSKKGGQQAITLNPPGIETKHKQEVGHIFVEQADLAFPQIHIKANTKKSIKEWRREKGPDIHVSNATTIPVKVRLGTDYKEYYEAKLGEPIGKANPSNAVAVNVNPKEEETFMRSVGADTYLFVLSGNSTELVLAKHGLGVYIDGSKTIPLTLELDLEAASSRMFFLPSAAPSPGDGEVGGGGGGAGGGEGGGDAVQPVQEPAPPASSAPKVMMSLKLRGNNLPIKDARILGGKSDPYFQIRPAFGPSYSKPNHKMIGGQWVQQPPTYKGEHKQFDDPFLESEVVNNELNPRWKTCLLDLTKLCHNNGHGGVVDLSRKVLIDVYDKDIDDDDFMCFLEVSLQDLVDAAASRAPLLLAPPPPPHTQSVGCLFVDKAVVGFPEVHLRDSRGGAPTDGGLQLLNSTKVVLQLLVAQSREEYAAASVGSSVSSVDYKRAVRVSPGHESTLQREMLGSGGAQLIILNESNMVVGRTSVGSGPGSKVLFMDLDSEMYAMSPKGVHEQLQANYQLAVGRIGELAKDEVELTDDDFKFFRDQMKRSKELAMLLPVFGMQGQEESLGLASFEAFLERQKEQLRGELLKIDLLSGGPDAVPREAALLKKLHMVDQQSGQGEMALYSEMKDALTDQLERVVEDAEQAMLEHRPDSAARGLDVLQAASESELTKHIAQEDFITGKLGTLRDKLMQQLKAKGALLSSELAARDAGRPEGFTEEKAAEVSGALAGLLQAGEVDWKSHLDKGEVTAAVNAGKAAVEGYLGKLLQQAEAAMGAGGEGRLGRCSGFVREVGMLAGLPGVEGRQGAVAEISERGVRVFEQTQAEAEALLREVAVFVSGAGWRKPGGGEATPHLGRLPRLVADMVGARWMAGDGEAGAAYSTGVEAVKKGEEQSVEVMMAQARAAAASGVEEAVHKVLYVSEQVDLMAEVGAAQAGAGFRAFEAEAAEAAELLGRFAQAVKGQVERAFPWHAEAEEQAVATLVAVDLAQAARVEAAITALVAYAERKQLAEERGQFQAVQATMAGCVKTILERIKAEVALSLPADGEVCNVDSLRQCLRTAWSMQRDYPALYGLGPDVMHLALQQLAAQHSSLGRQLEMNKDQAETLLQCVRRLCILDDVIADEAKRFTPLFQRFEESLKAKKSEVMGNILAAVEGSSFPAVDDLLAQQPDLASDWQVKAAVSDKVELLLEGLSRRVRELTTELAVEEVEAIHKEHKALAKAKSLVQSSGAAREDVQAEYARLMGGEGGGRLKTQLLEKLEATQQGVERMLEGEQFPKAVAAIRNVEAAWPVLEAMLGERLAAQQPSVREAVRAALQEAAGGSLAAFRELEVESYLVKPPADQFRLFADMPQFEAALGDLWADVEAKISAKIEDSFLGEGSRELAMLTEVIAALPEKPGKSMLLKKVEEGKTAAQGEMALFNQAMQDRDHEQLIMIAKKSTGSTQEKLWDKLAARLDEVRKEFCSQLDASPTTYMFDFDFGQSWKFVGEIQREIPEAKALQYAISQIYKKAQGSLRKAELDATSQMSCMVDGRSIAGSDHRFKDLDTVSEFLQRLVELKCGAQGNVDILPILPDNPDNADDRFGSRCRSSLRDLVDDYKKVLKSLSSLLKTDAPEKAFDVSKILACLKKLQGRADIFADAREMLDKLDGVLSADGWQSISLASVSTKAPLVGGAAGELKDWGEIVDKVRRWVMAEFKEAPDMATKIKISSDRVRHFHLIGRRAAAADALPKLEEVIGTDGEHGAVLQSDYQAKVRAALTTVWKKLMALVTALKDEKVDPKQFSDDGYSNKQDNAFHATKARFDEVNQLYGAVSLYQEYIAGCMRGEETEAIDLDLVSSTLLQRMRDMAAQVEALGPDLDGVAGMLMCMHSQAEELLFQSEECKKEVASALEKFQSAEATKAMGVSKLAVKLRHARMRPAGEAVVRGYDAFQGYLTQVFNQKTQSQDIKYVMDHIKVDNGQFNTTTTDSIFKQFDAEYKKRVDDLLTGTLTESQLVHLIKQTVDKLNIHHAPGCVAWTVEMKRKIPELTALVFAVWTLHHSKRFLQAMDSSDKKAFLFQPHPVQVVAIFALLGMDSTGAGVQRSLVQVRTGEGKSAVLGVTAAVFALFKCRVSCACYSEYLSQRDGDSMAFLFQSLGVLEDVKYMTLTQVCEYETNKKVNIREQLEALIMGGSGAGGGGSSGAGGGEWKPRVLLVDEVDVFFSRDFYGSPYVPSCALRHGTIAGLIREIYKTGLPLTLKAVQEWNSYKEVTEVLKGWEFLVDSAVSELLACMQTFAEDIVENEYVVKDDKIGYKEQDSIAFNISYGYTTLLAYLKENQSGNISEHSLARNLKFNVRCGSFSYAKLPRDFDLVMGVTGTLETMGSEEHRIVKEEYDIKKLVYMPSVYGHNQVQTRRIAALASETEFNDTLVEEIETHRKNRAAIVFFDSSQELRAFAKQFQHADDANYLLEEIYPQEKDQIVKIRAAQLDAITLATKPFGRGTDFQCMDDTVQQHGGIHIIQTFVAETLSEEIQQPRGGQIKGRTARQGEKGSWSMVLRQSEVTERYQIDAARLEGIKSQGESDESRKQMWELLNGKRKEICEQELLTMVEGVKQTVKVHEAALKFTDSLVSGDVADVKKHLKANNISAATAGLGGKARILVLLDATSSMGRMMDAAKETVGLMFDRAGDIIREQLGETTENFEMQFAVYRNYSSGPEQLLEASAWKSDPQALREFLSTCRCSGGQGNEAVEIAFWHANQEENVKQIVIIADAAGNKPVETDLKRNDYCKRRRNGFVGTRFEQRTTTEEQMVKLQEKKIPVDAFYLVKNFRTSPGRDDPKLFFEKICADTGGKNQYLDVQSPEGRELFIGHITTAILANVDSGGADLVGAYLKKFGGGKMHS